MFQEGKDTEDTGSEYISTPERNKLLWSLRSDFAWAGKKIPESIEIDGKEYRLRDMVRTFGDKEFHEPEETAELKALIPKLRERAKADEEMLEVEELTKAEAESLYEEAVGLLRAAMELKDRLEGKGGERAADDLKRMLNAQKVSDEKRFQELIKSLK
ncbi:hypothetical protein FTO70_05015 [Methanosarcina sp. KYL-1]|uniref:DUF5788 family protein n=1 Tax=Methanosarcina sp. KYL-1 TaxID=2602068 RepID=UPI00210159CC|nr:DUF5788 family protein [Methanosarcina sp. KYL-1]MCQ1535057.1 hypothetical protein [Methanosarcina sp. KYL-1]